MELTKKQIREILRLRKKARIAVAEYESKLALYGLKFRDVDKLTRVIAVAKKFS